MASSDSKRSVLFICLGNICRSPIAEAVFISAIKKRGEYNNWTVDSAAVAGYHTGSSPDHRAMKTILKMQGEGYRHKARVVTPADFENFDYIFGMDDENIEDLRTVQSRCNNPKAKLDLLGTFDPKGHREVPDPYYVKGVEKFEEVYAQCVRCCDAFLASL